MLTKQFIEILIYPFCLILLLGCTMRVGKRMEDGTNLTLNGEVISYYIGPYDLTLQAGLQIISSLEMPIHERHKARDGIVIKSETPGGLPLCLQFIKEGRAITKVNIRTGKLGYLDNEFSYQLHAFMKAQLNQLNQQSVQLKLMNQKKPVQEPSIDTTPTVASSDIRAATSATKPSVPVKAPSLKPAAAKLPNEENTAKTVASVSGEPLPMVESVSKLQSTKPSVSIFFDADSNLPAEAELTKLDRIALQALSNLNTKMALTGFVGEFDVIDQAELLSKSRVMAVKYYLIGKGVVADQIVAVPQTLIKK